MNTVYISLNKNIEVNSLIQKIQNMLTKHGNTNGYVLKIEICRIAHESNELIPKLEYKTLD